MTLELDSDVLVIGGGPAATWAALTARQSGARVLLVDKGFCGSSGVAAAATAGHWWVPPDKRDEAIMERDAVGGNLSETSWAERVLEETWRRWPEVGESHGYPAGGGFFGRALPNQWLCQGPVYLREMRRRVSHSGARILDHSPALELLVDDDGAVRGAAGVQRQKDRPWRATAGAVILATGGCAWKSGALGSNVDTGDGYLMAAEVGATLSGMEFSNYYGIVAKGGSLDKNGFHGGATFSNADGDIVGQGFMHDREGVYRLGGATSWLLRESLDGPLYAIIDKPPPEAWASMRAAMPNFFIALDRQGVNPFKQRFEIEYILEGTVRGTGGVRVVDDTCWSGTPGLWLAGDVASREAIVGAASGAGAPNSAWTVSSGTWSGRAAAAHALAGGSRNGFDALRPAGRVGLRPTGTPLPEGAWRELTRATQDEMLPPEKNGFRHADRLAASLGQLEQLWETTSAGLSGLEFSGREALWARETASMIAVGRWVYLSATERTESRVMHQRDDYPERDPRQRQRILVKGVDKPEVSVAAIADPVVPYEDALTQRAA
jgi:succinate dehydrogenase/fumarate reductase flavoprotein subunit